MDPSNLRKIVKELRESPAKMAASLLAVAILFLFATWLVGFFQEKGRSAAVSSSMLQDEPAIRVQYYRFQGTPLLDFVLQGRAFSPQQGFEYEPIWFKNRVYSQLADLIALNHRWDRARAKREGFFPFGVIQVVADHPELGARKEHEFYDWMPEGHGEDDEGDDFFRKQLVGAMSNFRGQNFSGSLNIDYLLWKLRNDPFWTLLLDEDGAGNHYGSGHFNMFAALSKAEVDSYRSHGRPALGDPVSRILLDRYPDSRDVVFLEVYYAHGSYSGIILVREIKLLAVAFENVGDKPVGIESLRASVRKARDVFAMLDPEDMEGESASDSEVRLPLEMLLPGEELFVPLRIEFGFPSPGLTSFIHPDGVVDEASLPDRSVLARYPSRIAFKMFRGVDGRAQNLEGQFQVDRSVLAAKYDFQRHVRPDYYLGDVIEPKELVLRLAGGRLVKYPVREFDPHSLLITGGHEKGSCPIVYAQIGGSQKRIGPVLVNAIGRNLEAVDHREVPLGSSLRLVEEEAETSYLDWVGLRVTYKDGREEELLLKGPPELTRQDQDYLILRRGEDVDLEFELPPLGELVKSEIMVKGFYVPDAALIESRRVGATGD